MRRYLNSVLPLFFLILLISPIFSRELQDEKEKIESAISIAEDSTSKSSKQNEDENAVAETKSGIEPKWEFSAGAIGGFLNKPEIKAGNTHFSGVDSFEAFLLPDASADFSLEFYKNSAVPLLTIKASTALTLLYLEESVSLSVPIPFFPLVSFSVGAEILTGLFYNYGVYDPNKKEYEENGGFQNFQYKFSGTANLFLPFSNKMTVLGYYELAYDGLTGAADSDLWTGGNFNGLSHSAGVAALYYLPAKLDFVGFLGITTAKLDDSSLDSRYSDFDGTFRSYLVSPFANFSFNKKNSLFLLAPFGNRRSFSVLHKDSDEEPLLKTSGSEWAWMGIILKYTHKF